VIPVIYIGIDPGAGGGLACLGPTLSKSTASRQTPSSYAVAIKMPDTDAAILNWLRSHKAGLGGTTFVIMEKVGGYVNRTERGFSADHRAKGHLMFNFGDINGALRMAVVAAVGRPPIMVQPAVWQRALGISPRGKREPQGKFKTRLKRLAQELFPAIRVTLSTADALLITEFCRREKEGTLKVYENRRKYGRARSG
jgi:hypothetical protein